MRRSRLVCITTIAGLSFTLAACGSSDKKAAEPAPAASGGAIAVSLKEFSVSPAAAETAAGSVSFDVKNEGKVVHEMVVVKLADGAGLDSITKPDGTASEDASVGEAADIEPGATKSTTIDLKAGTYALICNLPGHFTGGMKTVFTVK